jgi:GNAT superfamily N-acetyltransferase
MMGVGWSVRIARPEDAAAVSALLERSYPTLWADHHPPELLAAVIPAVTRANPILLASRTFFVAVTPQGDAVGCGGWTREAPGTGEVEEGVGHLRHFATDPQWLRQGIGAAIVAQSIAGAREARLTTLMADSACGAEAFYAAAGFVFERVSAPLIGGVILPGTMMRLSL